MAQHSQRIIRPSPILSLVSEIIEVHPCKLYINSQRTIVTTTELQ